MLSVGKKKVKNCWFFFSMGSPWSLVGVTRLLKDKKVGEQAPLLGNVWHVQYEPSGVGEGSARELLTVGRKGFVA